MSIQATELCVANYVAFLLFENGEQFTRESFKAHFEKGTIGSYLRKLKKLEPQDLIFLKQLEEFRKQRNYFCHEVYQDALDRGSEFTNDALIACFRYIEKMSALLCVQVGMRDERFLGDLSGDDPFSPSMLKQEFRLDVTDFLRFKTLSHFVI